jgi:hypothetical protein
MRRASDSEAATAYHADATSAPSTGTWYHLIGVNDVADGQLALRGVLNPVSIAAAGKEPARPVVSGLWRKRIRLCRRGDDDVRFFNSPLSASVAKVIGGRRGRNRHALGRDHGFTDLYGAFRDINTAEGVYSNEIRNSGFDSATH